MTDELNEHQKEVQATKNAINYWLGKSTEKKEESINENSMNFFGFNKVSNKEIKTSKKDFAEWKKAYKCLKETQGEYSPISDDGDKVTVPVSKTTLGTDTSPGPTKPVRVTPDWSEGPRIRKLDELKKEQESLQRVLHELEAMNGSKKKIEDTKKRLLKVTDAIEGKDSDFAPTPYKDGLGNIMEI